MLVPASSRLACCAALAGLLVLAALPALAQAPATSAAETPASDSSAPDSSAPDSSEPVESKPAPAADGATSPAVAPPSPAPGPLSLTWVSADPSCDGSQVGPRALELVSQNIVPRPTEARAIVQRTGEHWRVQLETRSESRVGQRTLRGESCKEIQQAISLLLAMIMEAEAKGVSPPGPPPEPLSMLNPDEDPVVDTAPAPLPPPRGWNLLLRSEGAVAVGLQPSLGLGVGGSIGVALGNFELHVGGTYWPSSRASIFDREGVIEMSRQGVGASLCYRWLSSGRFELLSCLGPEWLWMQWSSGGLLIPREGTIRHLLTLSGSLDFRLAAVGPVFVALTPGFTWEQRRPFRAKRCTDCAFTDVFQTWDIGVRFGAGIGARF